MLNIDVKIFELLFYINTSNNTWHCSDQKVKNDYEYDAIDNKS